MELQVAGLVSTSNSLESFLCLLMEAFFPLVLSKSSKPAKYKVMGIGSKDFASESLGVIVSGAAHFYPLIPEPGSPGYGSSSTICWMLIQSMHSFLEDLALALQGTAT